MFSVNQFISRENIAKRLDSGKRVSLRELLYPLMQGYDSVEIKADIEVGGTDQKFNLLAGRDLQKHYKQEAQDIIMGPIIEGLDGRKMSSSYGNTVNLFDTPNDMFGKLMTVRDESIINYFINLTRVSQDKINEYEDQLKSGTNPRDIKIQLAKAIVEIYHSKIDADKAEQYFINTFTKKEIPDEITEFTPSNYDLMNILVESGLVESKGEARRVLEQKGIKVNGEIIEALDTIVDKGAVIQKGKINFIKIG